MPRRYRQQGLRGRTMDELDELAEELKEFENVPVPERLIAPPPAPPPPNKCKVKAGSEVQGWDGRLSPSQCARLPPGKELGEGSFATAYEYGDSTDKVVKFTADKEDAITSSRLLGKDLERTVKVFDVVKLKHQKATAPVLKKKDRVDFVEKHNQPLFGIVTERLSDLDEAQQKAANAFHRIYTRRESYDPTAVSPREMARESDPERFRIGDYVDAYEVEQQCERVTSIPNKSACATHVGEIFDAVDELARNVGVIPLDLHSGNWGVKPNGKMAILDLGVSAGKGKPPRIKLLAGATRKKK